ncbi:MAG: M42 family metallopeptidase [Deltaproteobacteria bacterium]
MIELIEKLTSINGASGNEQELAKAISEIIAPNVDEIQQDSMGNLICVKKGTGKKVMLAAHMDEVAVIITHIEDNGFLRFAPLGGINHFYSLYQKVAFDNGTVGVIAHEENIPEIKDIKISNLYIDIGCKNSEEASNKIKIGDSGVFIGRFVYDGAKIISKALDDRCGCAILLELSKKLKDCENEIIYAFTTQEEVGLRGAKTAGYSVNPDFALVLDVTAPGDTPKSKPSPIKCGYGPIIKIMDNASIINPKLKNLIIETAEKEKIPYQLKVANVGGTDAGAISLVREGIPTASLAIPCRYLHSPAEMVDVEDVKNMIKLVEAVIRNIKE